SSEAMEGDVAITLDDGAWFDFHDLDHPTCGLQRGMLGILQDFRKEVGTERQPSVHATSFVIASPQAREELDREGLIGKGWWGDEWWAEAERSGLMEIACHSWDHLHPDLDHVAQRDQRKGDFHAVDSEEDCDLQVARAGDYLEEIVGRRSRYFAYPWGQVSAYLAEEYLPGQRDKHGFEAAFTTEGRAVRRGDDPWRLPRYVFGRDWREPGDLERLLAAV
ncbi:MAG: polysaccharide deacetylase family protein, partial [Xanthomonadales bacterium]|nr:polysaccharide deacetylase family protein [Xanthomonadales bacterium]